MYVFFTEFGGIDKFEMKYSYFNNVTMDRRVLSLTWMEPPEMCRQPYAVDRRINLSNLYSHLNYVKAWIAVFIPILH
ncbi:hypothetical protein NPIL_231901, partial [Nephila pilipes]